ncbi:MAG: NAD(P)H-hydrate dehydratase [Lentisphaeria bacterium]|nr:NAD(P)H-hydrate dehydratase [Lentisphaeria bacterium]
MLPRNVHKYQRGAVLVAGGSKSYVQAPFLTARSALRSGAGLVKLAVPFKVAPGSGCLGVIPLQTADKDGFFCRESLNKELFSKVNAIAAGPGMGRSSSVTDAVEELLKSDLPLVLDADALFAAGRIPWLLQKRSAATVLTPHRGEASSLAKSLGVELTGGDVDDARKLACAANAVVLLKGARTVVASPEGRCIINTTGSGALATAGSGDTLTGIIAAELAAMHSAGAIDAAAAAARGAFLHGIAGELGALQWGSRGMIADDLPELIARAENIIAKKGDIF